MHMPVTDFQLYIFADPMCDLSQQCARWMATSPRFKAFAEAHRDKIRKKVRGMRDTEGLRDLQLELDTARCLLRERRISLEYEKYLAGKVRGPDFTARLANGLSINVEVKRLRTLSHAGKWDDALCDKLGQLPPSSINALVIAANSGALATFDVAAAMARLRELAERKDEGFFTHRGFVSARDFQRHLQRLSAIVMRSSWDDADGSHTILWPNTLAKHPLPPQLRTLLLRCFEP